jgi:hypothetical protein
MQVGQYQAIRAGSRFEFDDPSGQVGQAFFQATWSLEPVEDPGFGRGCLEAFREESAPSRIGWPVDVAAGISGPVSP